MAVIYNKVHTIYVYIVVRNFITNKMCFILNCKGGKIKQLILHIIRNILLQIMHIMLTRFPCFN